MVGWLSYLFLKSNRSQPKGDLMGHHEVGSDGFCVFCGAPIAHEFNDRVMSGLSAREPAPEWVLKCKEQESKHSTGETNEKVR